MMDIMEQALKNTAAKASDVHENKIAFDDLVSTFETF